MRGAREYRDRPALDNVWHDGADDRHGYQTQWSTIPKDRCNYRYLHCDVPDPYSVDSMGWARVRAFWVPWFH